MSSTVAGPEHRRQIEHARAIRAKFFPAQPVRVLGLVDGESAVMDPIIEQSIDLAGPPEPPEPEPEIVLPPITQFTNEEIEEEFRRRFDAELEKMFDQWTPAARRLTALKAKDIIKITAAEFQVTIGEIKGIHRPRKLVEARMTAIWRVAISNPGLSLPAIGRLFGGRDHTTVLHALRRVDDTYRALPRAELIDIIMKWTNYSFEEAARVAERDSGYFYHAIRAPKTGPRPVGSAYSRQPLTFLPPAPPAP